MAYEKLTEIISEDTSGSLAKIKVNNQWTFTVPDGIDYYADSEFDGWIEGGIDLSGSIKPLVLKDYLHFNVALQKHYDFSGNYFSVDECRYDNRFLNPNNGNSQKIIRNDDAFYVDLTSENIWPLGTSIQLRVRGEKIDAFDFYGVLKGIDQDDWEIIKGYLVEIAESITPIPPVKKTVKKSAATISDPNCILSGTTLTRYIGNDTDIVLPSGITAIADNTFSGRTKITSVVVPEGVKKIGSRAFENCFALERIELPESLEELGEYAFVDCHKLQSVYLSDKIKAIESSVFSECYSLENVIMPKKLKYIDAFAFKNCRNFTNITLPDGLESIGCTAFAYCNNLTGLYIPESVNMIQDNFMNETPFAGCDNLTIHSPAGSYAQLYAQEHNISRDTQTVASLTTKIKVKAEVKSAKKTTASTPTVKSNIPRVRELSENSKTITLEYDTLTEYTGKLKHIRLPDNIDVIATDAFLNSSIESIVIPEGVSKIESDAFFGCHALTFVSLPESLWEIENHAFRFCDALEYIIIPESVNEIGFDAFNYCDRLKDIYVLGKYTDIGMDAFSTNCDDMVIHCLPESNAEEYCKENDIPYDHKKAPNILKEYTVEDVKKKPKTTKSESDYKPAEQESEIEENAPMEQPVSVPIEDCTIERKVLTKCNTTSHHIALPNGFTVIDKYLFYQKGLISVQIPEGVREIREGAFFKCAKLKRVVLPSTLQKIGKYAFSACKRIEKIEIPDGVTVIGENAFYSCSGLKRVLLPNTLQKINSGAFSFCEQLEQLVIPDGVTEIGEDLTQGCDKLTHVEIPEGIVRIEKCAFWGEKLKDVYLPASVQFIDSMAFSSIAKLVAHTPKGSFMENYCKEHFVRCDNDFSGATLASYKKLYEEECNRKEQEEAERLRKEQEEAERIRKERERKEQERLERERLERERKESERLERERIEQERKERERSEKERIERERREKRETLLKERAEQERIIAENKGIFGKKAQMRKAAQARIVEIDAELADI